MSTATTTSSSTSKKSSRRVVTFAKSAKMRFALHINNYTEEEINACFYTHSEFCQFKKDVKQIMKKLSSVANKKKISLLSLSLSSSLNENDEKNDENENDHDDFSTTTTRGIDSIQQVKAKSEIRKAALIAVIRAQSSFCMANEQEDEASIIAKAYSMVVQPSAAVAYAKGLADEKIAQQQQQDDQDVHHHHRNDYNNKQTTATNISAKFMMMSSRGSKGALWRLSTNNRTGSSTTGIRNHAA